MVDLNGIIRIDGAGEDALVLMKIEGAGFLASAIRMKHLLKYLRQSAAREP